MEINPILGIFLVALIGAFVASVIPRKLKEREKFNDAAVIFRSKVLSEIEGLYSIPVNWPDSIEIEPFLRSKFPQIQSAVEEFKMCLPKRRQRRFIKAWIQYYSATGEAEYQSYTHYMPFISTHNVDGKQVAEDTRDTYKEMFKHNVENLLSFTRQST